MTLSRSGAASVVGLTGGQLFERNVGLFAWLCESESDWLCSETGMACAGTSRAVPTGSMMMPMFLAPTVNPQRFSRVTFTPSGTGPPGTGLVRREHFRLSAHGKRRRCGAYCWPDAYFSRPALYSRSMGEVSAEELVGEEWAEWYRLTPCERFLESMKLWETYLALGGSLEPEPDTQSPFFDPDEWRENAAHGRTSLRVLRGGRV